MTLWSENDTTEGSMLQWGSVVMWTPELQRTDWQAKTRLAGRLPDSHIRLSKQNSNENSEEKHGNECHWRLRENLERKGEVARSHIHTLCEAKLKAHSVCIMQLKAINKLTPYKATKHRSWS